MQNRSKATEQNNIKGRTGQKANNPGERNERAIRKFCWKFFFQMKIMYCIFFRGGLFRQKIMSKLLVHS